LQVPKTKFKGSSITYLKNKNQKSNIQQQREKTYSPTNKFTEHKSNNKRNKNFRNIPKTSVRTVELNEEVKINLKTLSNYHNCITDLTDPEGSFQRAVNFFSDNYHSISRNRKIYLPFDLTAVEIVQLRSLLRTISASHHLLEKITKSDNVQKRSIIANSDHQYLQGIIYSNNDENICRGVNTDSTVKCGSSKYCGLYTENAKTCEEKIGNCVLEPICLEAEIKCPNCPNGLCAVQRVQCYRAPCPIKPVCIRSFNEYTKDHQYKHNPEQNEAVLLKHNKPNVSCNKKKKGRLCKIRGNNNQAICEENEICSSVLPYGDICRGTKCPTEPQCLRPSVAHQCSLIECKISQSFCVLSETCLDGDCYVQPKCVKYADQQPRYPRRNRYNQQPNRIIYNSNDDAEDEYEDDDSSDPYEVDWAAYVAGTDVKDDYDDDYNDMIEYIFKTCTIPGIYETGRCQITEDCIKAVKAIDPCLHSGIYECRMYVPSCSKGPPDCDSIDCPTGNCVMVQRTECKNDYLITECCDHSENQELSCRPYPKCIEHSTKTLHDCESSPDKGICRAMYFEKWYYDKQTMTCKKFEYSGCGGNGNRYNTEEECKNSCGCNNSN
jgi:collagen type VI alpha